jgi:ubiquitin carboxyl-terminal hydrolase 5/13
MVVSPPTSGLSLDSNTIDLNADGRYTLVAVISHLGANTSFGHYVCHVKRDGQWYLFNDDKVGKSSAKKALEYGFLYLYARND